MSNVEFVATRPKPINHYAELNAIANHAAILLNIDDALLTEWFNRQFAHWQAHAAKVHGALSQRWAAMRGRSFPVEDPTWLKFYELEMRFQHAMGRPGTPEMARYFPPVGAGTIPLLRERGHVLVCRQHGIEGVEPEEWESLPLRIDVAPAAFTMGQLYKALAHRGIFDLPESGDYGQWERDCEKCARDLIKAQAERAFEAFRKATT